MTYFAVHCLKIHCLEADHYGRKQQYWCFRIYVTMDASYRRFLLSPDLLLATNVEKFLIWLLVLLLFLDAMG